MKINKLTNGLLVSLLLASSIAGAESKYPAADFQPKVVYQDDSYKHSSSSSRLSTASTGETSAADPNFPAANFEPKVVYQDKNYKHKADKASSRSVSSSTSSTSSSSSASSQQAATADAEDSTFSLVLGLAILAIAGFVFYSKNNKIGLPAKKKVVRRARATSAPAVSAATGDAVSGVAKYLESKVGAKPSSVAKYLEQRESTPVSGVAKYVAKKKVSARLASVTGVEKYLKDKG